MHFGMEAWRTFEKGTEKEWLVTNGIGGYASSTLIGANTRRYHGLLVAALNPPAARHLVLSKIDESIVLNGISHNLYSFRAQDFTMEGFKYLQRAEIADVPTFFYSVGDVLIEKRVVMVYGKNTVCVFYRCRNGSDKALLKLAPLVNYRDYHHTSSRQNMRFAVEYLERKISITPYDMDVRITVTSDCGRFVGQKDCWFYNMKYPVESERGLDDREDHLVPGYFELELNEYEEKLFTITASTDGDEYLDGFGQAEAEEGRIEKVIRCSGYSDPLALELVRACDKFIVKRNSTGAKTVIAGYPWFTDWGRDTMIAFTGLTIMTKRYEEAREILITFVKYIKDGLIPNVFPDMGVEPAYNSVDAPLWFIEAVYRYGYHTGDYEFVRLELLTSIKSIIDNYIKGTRYEIGMDSDCLIKAGNHDTQLTWMDAMVWGRPVTPRYGKAVEINALWYNALMCADFLERRLGMCSSGYGEMAETVKESFMYTFWNNAKSCLYDYVTGNYADEAIRPNQIFAAGLTFPVLDGEPARKVVEKVWKCLYTPFGLKSLANSDPGYKGIYKGDPGARDSAYHQGTVWVWPLGYFITAYLKVFGSSSKQTETALQLLLPVAENLHEACIGAISEIFDADPPHYPRGCFAQAWSAAEVLRAYIELSELM